MLSLGSFETYMGCLFVWGGKLRQVGKKLIATSYTFSAWGQHSFPIISTMFAVASPMAYRRSQEQTILMQRAQREWETSRLSKGRIGARPETKAKSHIDSGSPSRRYFPFKSLAPTF